MEYSPGLIVAFLYVVMSAVTMIAYAMDKRAARVHASRISERMLHALAFAFGWPGALIAQQLFRHKRKKLPFVITTYAIAAVQTTIVILLFSRRS